MMFGIEELCDVICHGVNVLLSHCEDNMLHVVNLVYYYHCHMKASCGTTSCEINCCEITSTSCGMTFRGTNFPMKTCRAPEGQPPSSHFQQNLWSIEAEEGFGSMCIKTLKSRAR